MFKILQVIPLLFLQYDGYSLNAVPEFTAVFNADKNIVIIRWEHRSNDIKTYTIQRSLDNISWADIALQGINPNAGARSFYFEDKKPTAGENYYRLKCIGTTGKIEYSLSIMIIIGSPQKSWIMYPVPVKDVLTLEYKGAEKIKGVINVFIQQSSGKIITRIRSASLNRVIKIPVDNLSRGIYDVRIIIEGEIAWNQRFVK